MAITSPRATIPAFRVAPSSLFGDLDRMLGDGDITGIRSAFEELINWQRLTAEVLNGAMAGKINVVDTLTLTESVASTTFTSQIISGQTVLILTPTTANAAAELATMYQTYPNATEGQAVINHANNAQTDRTFACAYIG